jgi:hypothetical protein
MMNNWPTLLSKSVFTKLLIVASLMIMELSWNTHSLCNFNWFFNWVIMMLFMMVIMMVIMMVFMLVLMLVFM